MNSVGVRTGACHMKSLRALGDLAACCAVGVECCVVCHRAAVDLGMRGSCVWPCLRAPDQIQTAEGVREVLLMLRGDLSR